MKIIAGVDEAGRGSVLGPLVVAAVSVEESRIGELVEMGVKDSKLLAPRKRRTLFAKIKSVARGVSVWKINPRKIDRVVFNGQRLFRLNYLEARYMARALSKLDFDVAYLDCCDTDQERYSRLVGDLLDKQSLELGRPNIRPIYGEHHADRRYPIVSAASIIAKVTRDACIKKIRNQYGELGSGYPSDSETICYLRGFLERSKQFPEFTRLSWDTIKRLEEESEVSTLDEFSSKDT